MRTIMVYDGKNGKYIRDATMDDVYALEGRWCSGERAMNAMMMGRPMAWVAENERIDYLIDIKIA